MNAKIFIRQRQKSLSSIEISLKKNGIVATTKQIGKKLTDLKNYYGGQRRLIESSKASGAGSDEVYSSQWKFYDRLALLSDAFTPRTTKNNSTISTEQDMLVRLMLKLDNLLQNRPKKLQLRKTTSSIK